MLTRVAAPLIRALPHSDGGAIPNRSPRLPHLLGVGARASRTLLLRLCPRLAGPESLKTRFEETIDGWVVLLKREGKLSGFVEFWDGWSCFE